MTCDTKNFLLLFFQQEGILDHLNHLDLSFSGTCLCGVHSVAAGHSISLFIINKCLVDGDKFVFKIYITPLQAQSFTQAHAGHHRNEDRIPVLMLFAIFQIVHEDEMLIYCQRFNFLALSGILTHKFLYHETIDHTSHHDEQGVFNACDKAMNEIKNLVKIITNELNGINIVVTSDHGFIYTYEPLAEDDKLSKSDFKKDIIKHERRYIITDMDAHPDFLIPIKGFYNDNGYQAFSPRENIRIKGSGSLNFVHGGASLQEMVVPVVQYRFLRSGYKAYTQHKYKYDTKPVTIALLSSNRKVSNMIFNLNFYQKEAVVDNYVPCTYKLFLY